MRLLEAISDFFYKKILHMKKRQNANKRLSFRFFIRPESIKKQASNFSNNTF